MGITEIKAIAKLTPGGRPALELAELAELAERTAAGSKSQNTKKAYRADLNSFCSWAADHGLSALPAEPQTMRLYITHLDQIGRRPATISRALAAISAAHKLAGLESPINGQSREQFKAVCRLRGTAQRQARPLLASHLKKIISQMRPDVFDTRDKCILLIGFAGALRRSEISDLNFEDLEFVDAGVILTIRRSKTDQIGAGEKVAIPRVADSELCPVKALEKWIAVSRIASGALFRKLGRYAQGVFFAHIWDSRLGDKAINTMIKKWAGRAGLPAVHYSAHSLRAGWSTEAARIGLAMPLLMLHTRHKDPKIAAGYVRSAQLFDSNPLSMIVF
jgi:integrase